MAAANVRSGHPAFWVSGPDCTQLLQRAFFRGGGHPGWDESMKPLQLPQEILGIVGARETHLDSLMAQSIFDIHGGDFVAC